MPKSVANLVTAPASGYPSVGSGAVERVLLCDLYERTEPGYRAVASSLPGHLLQLTIAGRAVHEVEGRRYVLTPGSSIWYHEDQWVRVTIERAPWRFYTLNFVAPSMSPPGFEDRVRRVSAGVQRRFADLLRVWRDLAVPPGVRELRVQSAILALLADWSVGRPVPFATDPSAQLWWHIETELRRDLSRPVSLKSLAADCGRSPATIARSCHAALGMPPLRRVKQIRLSLARGLVSRSDLSISQIADRVGYSRVHEFSRDYRKHFGLSPRADRR